MKNYINLFEILGEKGDYGLIQYLKETTDTELQNLKKQYCSRKKMTNRDDIIIEILVALERALNRGCVFDDRRTLTKLACLYK